MTCGAPPFIFQFYPEKHHCSIRFASNRSNVRLLAIVDVSKRRVTDMAIEDALVVLSEHWGDVMARMDTDLHAAFARMLTALGEPGQPEATAQIADLLAEALPRDHPVRRALAGRIVAAPATLDWPGLARHLRGLLVTDASLGNDPLGATAAIADVEAASG